MAISIDQNYINQFSATLYLLLEQQTAKLRPVVDIEMGNGEKHFFDRLGSFTAEEVTSRNMELPLQDAAHSRRMATIRKYVAAASLDDLDKLKMLIDPQSDYARKLANAMGRQFDDVVLAAATGTAATGKDGSGTAPFATASIVDTGDTTNAMSVAKFNEGLRILEANEVDLEREEVYLIANAGAIKGLLADSGNQFTSFDFQGMKPLAGAALPAFRGVHIIRSQRPSLAGASVMLTKGAVKVAMAKDLNVAVKDQPSLVDVVSVAATLTLGAVRMEEERVILINHKAVA